MGCGKRHRGRNKCKAISESDNEKQSSRHFKHGGLLADYVDCLDHSISDISDKENETCFCDILHSAHNVLYSQDIDSEQTSETSKTGSFLPFSPNKQTMSTKSSPSTSTTSANEQLIWLVSAVTEMKNNQENKIDSLRS